MAGVWLDRFAAHSSLSTPTPPPGRALPAQARRGVQLGPTTIPRRPGLNPRTSSFSVATFGGSTDSLPLAARLTNGTHLKSELAGSPAADVPDPLAVLQGIIGPLPSEETAAAAADPVRTDVQLSAKLAEDIDFGGLSLQQYADAAPTHSEVQPEADLPSVDDFKREKEKFEDLHTSILACDEILKSVETYLTNFRADLAAVSSEIEHLQDRSTSLNNKLENRRAVEKVLGPEVEALVISPIAVRKITEGVVDDAWVKALDDLDKRSKAIDARANNDENVKPAQDMRPLIQDVSTKAVERIRDYVVVQIKALRSPNVNAQVIQQNALLRYRNVFSFLATKQPQLADDILQAYINTMRWYYSSHFTRYKSALDKLNLHAIDQTEVIGLDQAAKRTARPSAAHDAFSLGRRADILRPGVETALPSFTEEDDKSTHFLEVPFRAFNLALVDNASSEYSFLTEFFTRQPFHATNRKFNETFHPTFLLGQELTKHLIESSLDALGILICVRLTQHFAFELQRRKVPAAEGYINATTMLLWPRFQQILDAHCDSIRKVTASLPGKPAGSALSLTSSSSSAQTTAPHPLTQRFANLLQGILALSSEAGEDEPISHSLGRLRADFEAFLVKLSKGTADVRKRERFLYNNYSLLCTIIGDTEGRLAREFGGHFADLRDGLRVDV